MTIFNPYHRGVWRLAPLLLLLGVLLSAPASAVRFKIATLSPDSSSWMREMRSGADRIEQATEGRVRFKFYPGGVMGDDKTVLRKIRIRQLQGGALTSGSLSRIYPDNQVYNLPFKFRSQDEVDYVRHRMDSQISQGLADGGFITFGFAGGGFAYILSQQPVHNLDDLRSHKLWLPSNDPLAIEGLQAMGLNPIPLKLADVLTGLQTGLIDTITTSPVAAIALQWHTQIRYLTELPISYFYALLAVERSEFEGLSITDQQRVKQIMGEAFANIDRQNRLDNQAALTALRNQGIIFIKPTQEAQQQWHQTAHRVTQQLIDGGHVSAESYTTLNRHLKTYRSLHHAP